MRSASSRTRTSTLDSFSVLLSIRSSRRPGVATRMSTPRAESRALRPDGDAAEHHRRRQRAAPAIGAKAVGDLARQFPGRAQDQRAAGLWRGAFRYSGEPLQDRQGEGGGLAGAGLRDAAEVASGEHRPDRLVLIGVGTVAFGSEGAQKGRGKSKVGENQTNAALSLARYAGRTHRVAGRRPARDQGCPESAADKGETSFHRWVAHAGPVTCPIRRSTTAARVYMCLEARSSSAAHSGTKKNRHTMWIAARISNAVFRTR